MIDFHDISACPPARLPKDPTDVKAMLDILVKAERCAIGGCNAICNLTAGKDHRTCDLALAILHEKIEHEAWFSEFQSGGPSGHFRRPGTGSERNSAYLRKISDPLSEVGARHGAPLQVAGD